MQIRSFHPIVALGAIALLAGTASIASAQTVANGDFEGGNTGFSSDYGVIPTNNTSSTSPGQYGILTNPQSSFVNGNGYASYGDHTTGSSLMLFADGSTNSSARVWYENLTGLSANTNYNYSYWAASADTYSPASLQFNVGGAALGSSIDLSATPGQWQLISGSFNTGAATSLEVAITDANTIGFGNDFTLDDIKVAPAASPAPVPEPAVLALLASALPIAGGLKVIRRKKQA